MTHGHYRNKEIMDCKESTVCGTAYYDERNYDERNYDGMGYDETREIKIPWVRDLA